MAAKKVLVMQFQGGDDKIKITINKPKNGLTGEVVSAIMDEVIATNALGETYQASRKVKAEYVVQTTESLAL